MLPQPMNTSHAVPTLSTNNRLPSTAMPPPCRYAKRTALRNFREHLLELPQL
jgi:hypothetical protein